MGLFTGRQVYAQKWTVKSVDAISEDDAAMFISTRVVPSEYGMSCKFNFKEGYSQYIPVSTECNSLEIGECPNIKDLKVLTLSRPGDTDIYRIDVK